MNTTVLERPRLADQASPVTNRAIMLAAVAILDNRLKQSSPLKRFHNLESLGVTDKRAQLIAGTPLEAVAMAAAELGAPLTQNGQPVTVGHILDRGLMTEGQIHDFSCDCGHAISDEDAVARMREIAG